MEQLKTKEDLKRYLQASADKEDIGRIIAYVLTNYGNEYLEFDYLAPDSNEDDSPTFRYLYENYTEEEIESMMRKGNYEENSEYLRFDERNGAIISYDRDDLFYDAWSENPNTVVDIVYNYADEYGLDDDVIIDYVTREQNK